LILGLIKVLKLGFLSLKLFKLSMLMSIQ
jgi:hypothetical protein